MIMNTINASSRTFRRLFRVAIVSAVASGFAGISSADSGSGVRQVTVKFADLNVSTPQGAVALYARIRAAAKSVCGPELSSPPFNTAFDACVRKSVADAVTKVNQPEL